MSNSGQWSGRKIFQSFPPHTPQACKDAREDCRPSFPIQAGRQVWHQLSRISSHFITKTLPLICSSAVSQRPPKTINAHFLDKLF